MTKSQKKIHDALEAIGYSAADVHWEPIGRSLEMQGPMGGWFVDDEPIGYNVAQALEFIARRPSRFSER